MDRTLEKDINVRTKKDKILNFVRCGNGTCCADVANEKSKIPAKAYSIYLN